MATSNEKITHITHPDHTLSPISSINGDYKCDGCKLTGSGKRFSCDTCDFNLHEYCARAPATLYAFMDPHQLRLVVHNETMACDVCSEHINGMAYSCRHCDFDAHQWCTAFPEFIDLNADPKHYLKLQRDATPRECNVCQQTCTRMRYSCLICNVNVHVRCIAGWRAPRTCAPAAYNPYPAAAAYNPYPAAATTSRDLQPAAYNPHPTATTRDGGGGVVGNGHMFFGLLKMGYHVTSFVLDATTGVSLPDLPS